MLKNTSITRLMTLSTCRRRTPREPEHAADAMAMLIETAAT